MVFINHQTYLGGHIVGNIPAPWFASGITQLEMMCGGDRSSLSGLRASFMPRKKQKGGTANFLTSSMSLDHSRIETMMVSLC